MEESIHFLIGHLKKTFYNRCHYIMNDTTLLSRDSLNVMYIIHSENNQIGFNGMGLLFFSLLF